jgi:5-methylcytosine-specific restriction enzyme A
MMKKKYNEYWGKQPKPKAKGKEQNSDRQSLNRPRNFAFYNSREWRMLRNHKIKLNPLCQVCEKEDRITTADEVHHIIAINDDYSKRLLLDNLMSVCYSCHGKLSGNERKIRNMGMTVSEIEKNMMDLETYD